MDLRLTLLSSTGDCVADSDSPLSATSGHSRKAENDPKRPLAFTKRERLSSDRSDHRLMVKFKEGITQALLPSIAPYRCSIKIPALENIRALFRDHRQTPFVGKIVK